MSVLCDMMTISRPRASWIPRKCTWALSAPRSDVLHEQHRTAIERRIGQRHDRVVGLLSGVELDGHAGQLGEADREVVVRSWIVGAPSAAPGLTVAALVEATAVHDPAVEVGRF